MCSEYEEKISLFLDKQLNEADEKKLMEHISSCEECQQYLQQLESIIEDFKNLEEINLPSDLHEKIMQKVSETKKTTNNNNIITFNFKKIASISAVFLIMVLSMSTLLNSKMLNSTKSEDLALISNSSYGETAEIISESAKSFSNATEKDIALNSEPAPRMFAATPSLFNETRYSQKITNIKIKSDNIDSAKDFLINNYSIDSMELYDDYAYIEVRGNLENYEKMIEEILQLGTVINSNFYEEDLTSSIVTLKNQIKEKNNQSQRYLELMKSSDNVEELMYLSDAISNLEKDITLLNNQLSQELLSHNKPKITVNIDRTIDYIPKTDIAFSTKIKMSFINSLNDTKIFFTKFSLLIATLTIPFAIILILFIFLQFIIKKKRRLNHEK